MYQLGLLWEDKIGKTIHLIHGTWANFPRILPFQKPRWYEPGHVFYDTLARELGPDDRISQFSWGWGANFQAARANGANDLAEAIIADQDSKQHILIGHSHGGNVAMLTLGKLQEAGFCDRIESITSLATPFLLFRKIRFARSVYLFAATALLLAGVFWGIEWLSRLGLAGYVASLLSTALSALGLASLLGVAAYSRKLTASDVETPETTNTKLYILRQPGDEAGGLLSFFAPLSWLLSILTQTIEGALSGGWRLFLRLLLVGGAISLIVGATVYLFPTSGPEIILGILQRDWVAVLLWSSCAAIGAVILVRLAFGWDLPFRALDYHITAEVAPLGKNSVEIVPDDRSTGLAFAHSAIYSNPRVHRRVVEIVLRQ